jgi:hypothetical protein
MNSIHYAAVAVLIIFISISYSEGKTTIRFAGRKDGPLFAPFEWNSV